MVVSETENVDQKTVRSFGKEWGWFDHSSVDDRELETIFATYFSLFPWDEIGSSAVGADFGCGSGRWARLVAPKVGELHCVDASPEAIGVAERNLEAQGNCVFHTSSLNDVEIEDGSLDFAYSLGVLHHIPDTQSALRSCVQKLKPGAPFLCYLYYAFDDRPLWFRTVWRISDVIRRGVSRVPDRLKLGITTVIAAVVYWPLARAARVLERLGRSTGSFPLAFYRDRSFYVMRTDALDRFGTRLEKRFRSEEISRLCEQAGLVDLMFSLEMPYWTFLARKVGGTPPRKVTRTLMGVTNESPEGTVPSVIRPDS